MFTRRPTFGALKTILLVTTALLLNTLASPAAMAGTPRIGGTPKTTAVVGTQYAFYPWSSDTDGDTLHFTILNRPSWASFSYSTGSLRGTPTGSGTWSNIQIYVTDGTYKVALPAFSITATSSSTNRAPTISGAPPTSVAVGGTYSFRPTAADADGNSLGFSVTGKPSWLGFNTSTGQLWGQPTSANVGTSGSIVISVSDGKVTAKLPAFTIAVKSSTSSTTNSAPKISGTPTTSVKAGVAYSFTPTASDANGDALTFSISNKPAWAAFSTTTGRLSGTPTSSQVGTYSSIQIKVSDGKTSVSLPTFSITVGAVGTATGRATLQWTPPTRNTNGTALTNLAGFRIYYGTSSSAMTQTISITNASVSTYIVEDLSPATYYFAVKAVNSAGAESSLSNIASKRIY
jgi:hypothetical protein